MYTGIFYANAGVNICSTTRYSDPSWVYFEPFYEYVAVTVRIASVRIVNAMLDAFLFCMRNGRDESEHRNVIGRLKRFMHVV